MTLLKRQMQTVLMEGSGCDNRATAATSTELLNYVDNLWLFDYCKDVAPTNNAA